MFQEVTSLQCCPFCAIVRGEDAVVREVARNDKVVIFFPTEPAVLGYCMVIPRRHVEEFTALTADEVSAVMTSAQAMAMSLRETQHPDGINIIQSNVRQLHRPFLMSTYILSPDGMAMPLGKFGHPRQTSLMRRRTGL